MSGLTVNANPLMTRYLVGKVRAFAQSPVTLLDVGARGGANTEWEVFEDQVQIYCFEPDEAECERLMKAAASNVHYIPTALGAVAGAATLYEARLPASSGLYKTQMDYFGRLLNRENGVTLSERTVQVRTLDDVVKERGISDIDFIKIDTEGAELDILGGGSGALDSTNVLGILSEVRFQQEINGSPPFAALDAFLSGHGFRLFDLTAYHQSRRVLPYPSLANYRLPSGERFFANTQRGQLQDGDALYFRDLLIAQNAKRRSGATPVKLLKLCALMELYSFNDCAAELILENRDAIDRIVPTGLLLDLLSSGIAGREIDYKAYLDEYFAESPRPAEGPASTADSRVQSQIAAAQAGADTGQNHSPQPPGEGGFLSRLIRRISNF